MTATAAPAAPQPRRHHALAAFTRDYVLTSHDHGRAYTLQDLKERRSALLVGEDAKALAQDLAVLQARHGPDRPGEVLRELWWLYGPALGDEPAGAIAA